MATTISGNGVDKVLDTADLSTNDSVEAVDSNLRDYTLLATTPSNSGSFTLSESANNFEELVFHVSDGGTSAINTFTVLPVALMTTGLEYEVKPDLQRYSRWTYTNSTTFTYSTSADADVKAVYGKRRIV